MVVGESRWAILYCPRKGIFRSRKRWERLQKELNAQGVKYDFVQSESTDSVERLMTMLIHNGYIRLMVMMAASALMNSLMGFIKKSLF